MGYWQDREQQQDRGERRESVGRPRGTAWRALQADGIVWEGQVLLVGLDVDLAARLIVTHRRVAFARGGGIILDVPRAWLWPAPVHRRDGTVLLSINSPEASVFADPETVTIQPRDGQRAAGDLVALLAMSGARLLPPDDVDDRFPVRNALPPLPDGQLESAPPERLRRTDSTVVPPFAQARAQRGRERRPVPNATDVSEPDLLPLPSDEPLPRRSSPPSATGLDRDWNLQPIRGMEPRSRRRRRGWALRLGGLFLLLAMAALAGSGRITPGDNHAGTETESAANRSETTVAQVIPPTVTATATSPQRTALAFGVGGAEISGTETATSTVPPESTEQPTSTATPTPVPPTTTAPMVPTLAGDIPVETESAPATTVTVAPLPSSTPVPAPAATVVPTKVTAATEAPAPTEPVEPPPTPTSGPSAEPELTSSGGSLDVSVAVAKRGSTLPEFGLPESAFGEWVALVVTTRNTGDEPIQVAMDDFQLQAMPSGDISTLDAGTAVIAGVIGLDTAAGPGETLRVRPGRDRQIALIFATAPGAESLRLLVGSEEIDLGPSLDENASLSALGGN